MSLTLQIAVALVGGGAALAIVGRWPRIAVVASLVAAIVVATLAVVSGTDDALAVGSTGLQASHPGRIVAAGWAAGLVLLTLLALAEGSPAASALVAGSGLVALGSAIVALAVDDATVAFAALAGGGMVAVAGPSLGGWHLGRDDSPQVGLAARALAAVGGAGLLATLVAAWSQSPAGPLGDGSVAVVSDAAIHTGVGLGIVAMAAIVALRAGAIPLHLWAARLVGAVSPLAVPAVLGWGMAAFTIVAVGWGGAALIAPLDDLDRVVTVIAAVASIVFGGLASMLHDDLEHVLGYVIVQDAGVALLAFGSLRPEANDAAAAWVIATAALGTGLAAWIAAIRWTFGSHRLEALGGWARRSPILALAFVLVMAGFVGIPGMALFDARVRLAADVLPGFLGSLVVVVALSPLLALGRILVAGVGRASPDVAAATDERVGRTLGSFAAWSRGGARGWLRAGARVVRANEGLGVAAVSVALAAIGLALAVAGIGPSGS